MTAVALSTKHESSIFIIEDDPALRELLAEWLHPLAEVTFAENLEQARSFEDSIVSSHLLLLDERLPDGSGLEWYKNLCKKNNSLPHTVFISGVDDSEFIESCYAQQMIVDFVVKPFNQGELRAKVKRALQLGKNSDPKNQTLPEGFSITELQRKLSFKDTSVMMTPTEFSLLKLFLGFARPLSREEIIREIWGNMRIQDKTFDVHLCNFRKKVAPLQTYVHYDSHLKTYSIEFATEK